MSPADRRTVARKAAMRRWIRTRFGDSSFEDLGYPGGAMIDRGLDALAAGSESADALAVSLAAPRLRREGVPVPGACIPDADRRLYHLLESRHGELAHPRFLATLRQLASFADACREGRHA